LGLVGAKLKKPARLPVFLPSPSTALLRN